MKPFRSSQASADHRCKTGPRQGQQKQPPASPAHPAGPWDTLLFRPLSLGLVCHLAKADPSYSDGEPRCGIRDPHRFLGEGQPKLLWAPQNHRLWGLSLLHDSGICEAWRGPRGLLERRACSEGTPDGGKPCPLRW